MGALRLALAIGVLFSHTGGSLLAFALGAALVGWLGWDGRLVAEAERERAAV